MEENKKKVPAIKEDEEHVTVLLDSDEQKKKKNRNKKIIIGCVIGTLSLVSTALLVSMLYLLSAANKNKHNDEDILNAEAVTKYANLLNYLNKESEMMAPKKSIKSISALTIDANSINVFGENDDYSIVYKINANNLDDFLKPKGLGSYTVDYQVVTNENDALNLKGTKSVGKVYTINNEKHISYTTQYDNGVISSCVDATYNPNGVYPNETTIKPDSNQALYYFYSYLLNK